MTLRGRLAVSLTIIAVVLVVPLVLAFASMKQLHGEMKLLRSSDFQASLVLGRLRDALADVRSREIALGAVKGDTMRDRLTAAIHRAGILTDSLDRFRLDGATARIHDALAAIPPAAEREFEAVRVDSGNVADSISRVAIAPKMREAESALTTAEQILRGRTSDRVTAADEALGDALNVSVAALAVALLLATGIALWLTRSISEPVQALEVGMRAVADGDLEHSLQFDVTRQDEFGRLAISFQDMSRQLAELDKLKAEFVSIASHELKTPINVILGYLQLMEEGVYGPMNEKQVPIARTIQAQARTLARLAAQLLDVSRFEAGSGRIEPRPLKLPAMLDDLERTFHVLAVQRQVDFRVNRSEGLPVDVMWDADRINEVTGNLLANAFKFTPAGGTVELTAGPDKNGVCIEVRDSGAGIAPAQLPRIFEKFYQADNQRSASAKGTGLGLAIAKEIVDAHHGRITCASEVGVGTTFTLTLPVNVPSRRRSSGFHVVSKGEFPA